MACLHKSQTGTGAIQASLHQVGWTAATPSETAAPGGPEIAAPKGVPAARAATCLPKRAGVPPAATWSVQPKPTLGFLATSPGVTAQRAGVDPVVPVSVSTMLVARNLFPTGNATTVTGEPIL
jgi:hypothetical protein